PVNEGFNPVYRWFINGVEVPEATDAVYSYVPQDGDEVYVELTSSETCVLDKVALSNIIIVTVNEFITPVFDPIGPICQFNPAPELPETSMNGISGTWTPAVIDTSEPGTFEYVFHPEASYQCADS